MQQHQITDPDTGMTVTVEMDTPPTQEEAMEIMQQARGGGGVVTARPQQPDTEGYEGGWLSPPKEARTVGEYFGGIARRVPEEAGMYAKGAGSLALLGAGELGRQITEPGAALGELFTGNVEALKSRMQRAEERGAVAREALGTGVSGALKDIYRTLRYPVQSLYRRPVGTAIDIATIAFPIAKGTKAIKGVVAGQKAAGDLTTRMIQYAANSPDDFAKLVNEMAVKGTTTGAKGYAQTAIKLASKQMSPEDIIQTTKGAAGAERDAVRVYSSMFTVPTKRARDLKPEMVSRTMLKYNIGGNLDDLKITAEKVTGENGVLSAIARDVTAKLPEVPYDDALKQADDMAKVMTEITPTDIQAIRSDIYRILPATEQQLINIPEAQRAKVLANMAAKRAAGIKGTWKTTLKGTGLTPEEALAGGGGVTDIYATSPTNVMDLARQFERKAADYARHSTYLTPNLRYEQLAEIYRKVARTLEQSVENKLAGTDILEAYKTPEMLAQLGEISPQFADDFGRITTFRQLRSLQAPFVKLSQLVDLTKEAQLSAANKLAQRIGQALGSGTAAEMGMGGIMGSRMGPAGIVGGMVAAPVIGGLVREGIQRIPGVASKMAGVALKSGKALGKVKVGSKIAGIAGKTARNILSAALAKKFAEQQGTISPYYAEQPELQTQAQRPIEGFGALAGVGE